MSASPDFSFTRRSVTGDDGTHRFSSMAPALGKRKRRDQITDLGSSRESTAQEESANLQALFQQHFESTFEPLPGSFARPLLAPKDTRASDEEPETEWDGFSEHGEEYAETLHYATSVPSKAEVSKDEFRTFMVRVQILLSNHYYAEYVS